MMELTSRAEAKVSGAKWYYTGRECINGHIAKRDTARGSCSACKYEWKKSEDKKIRLLTSGCEKRPKGFPKGTETLTRAEAIRIGDSTYAGKPCVYGHIAGRFLTNSVCVECSNLRFKEYYRLSPDKEARRHKASYDSDIILSRYRVNNHSKKWHKDHPEAARTGAARRRALMVNAPGFFFAENIQRILVSQEYLCAAPFCSCSVAITYEVDHIIPLSKGGSNMPDNLQILCRTCNRSKGAKSMDVWVRENSCSNLACVEI